MDNTKALATLDEEWLKEIETAADEKQRQVVIPALLAKEHDRFYTKAIAHAITRGEHDAMMYASFYVIWKNRLFKAKCDTWEEYCEQIAREPYDLTAPTIKAKVIDINRARKHGMSWENVIRSLGNRPMATRKLVALPADKIPGGDINSVVASDWGELSSHEAMSAARIIADEPTVWCKDAVYIPSSEEYLFNAVVQATDGTSKEFDNAIPMVDPQVAKWLFAVMKPRDRGARE